MDPYVKEVLEEFTKAIDKINKMILWIAERKLSAKEFQEFINETVRKGDEKKDD